MMLATARQRSCMQVVGKDTRRDLHRVPVFFMSADTTMKRYIQAIARELNVPLTIRRVPGGVIFWRSSKEDLQQAKDVGARLQTAQRRQKARPTGRRPRETR